MNVERIALTAILAQAALLFGGCRGGHVHASPDRERFVTDRGDAAPVALANEEPAFQFLVFGDRTGGPRDGIFVLEQAVRDANLLAPDLVMTVGDLVEGYNEREAWLGEAAEFKSIMDRLDCPWFPVAGNHDIYWRGEGRRPEEEHEGDYEQVFGPLWYAFRHKDAWFVVLYSDEGDPETGERSFREPRAQRMSPAQKDWLTTTLQQASGARHVFVFLHHPRWHEGGYGEDWRSVHEILRAAGNVTAVFAGHIHRMQYDGALDGIEYFTVASVGAHLEHDLESTGHLHEFHVVTVRAGGIAVAAIPVGTPLDPRAITAEVQRAGYEVRERLRPEFSAPIVLAADGTAAGEARVRVRNPSADVLSLRARLEGGDGNWRFVDDEAVHRLVPGEAASFALPLARRAGAMDERFAAPELVLTARLHAPTGEFALAPRRSALPLDLRAVPAPQAAIGEGERALHLDGAGGWVAVEAEQVAFDDGPFTLEFWMRADAWRERQGLVNKTEGGEYGFFANRGRIEFLVHLDGRYASADVSGPPPTTGEWHHLAGVFDGAEVRVYVDGVLRGRSPASGRRTKNTLPLIIGGDVDRGGAGVDVLAGALDEVRLSNVARYDDKRFVPERRCATDESTLLLLHFDGAIGPSTPDAGPAGGRARLHGTARIAGLNPAAGEPR